MEALLAQMPLLEVKQGKSLYIYFRVEELLSIIIKITVLTLIRDINFYIMPTDMLFLLCIRDIDKLSIYLDNIYNKLIKCNSKITEQTPVI